MTRDELDALDTAVAKATGLLQNGLSYWKEEKGINGVCGRRFSPTRNPADWGPLIERHRIKIKPITDDSGDGIWAAIVTNRMLPTLGIGPTPAIAICRAVVAIGEAREGAA